MATDAECWESGISVASLLDRFEMRLMRTTAELMAICCNKPHSLTSAVV